MTFVIQRPGGALAARPLHFFWLVDCSGSMYGEKIAAVNTAIEETLPEMRQSAKENPNAQLLIRALSFSTGASWITKEAVPVEDYQWQPMTANGLTDLGAALNLVADELTIPPMSERALPPVLVLLSDGQPTSEYKKSLDRLLHLPWGKKSVRIAISIGNDADKNVLQEFTGNQELVLQADGAKSLTAAIKWASTVAAMVSTPASKQTSQTSSSSYVQASVDIDIQNKPDAAAITEDSVW